MAQAILAQTPQDGKVRRAFAPLSIPLEPRRHLPKMPSGPSLQGAQDWAPVVWQKSGPKGKAAKSSQEVNAARRSGAEVETSKKFGGGGNQSAHSVVPNAKKLDENTESFRHDTVSHDFKLALMQARTAKKMSQAALAQAINEKGSVINEYESGKAIPNGAIINKLNRALGVRLPKAK
uniref:HTH cro/C1-type domain-containing protein n=1 Tax=Alexandrium monilatum TaxID=311494 RepID=A0A7S4QEP1_9DINO